jgi:hypothetical protein
MDVRERAEQGRAAPASARSGDHAGLVAAIDSGQIPAEDL